MVNIYDVSCEDLRRLIRDAKRKDKKSSNRDKCLFLDDHILSVERTLGSAADSYKVAEHLIREFDNPQIVVRYDFVFSNRIHSPDVARLFFLSSPSKNVVMPNSEFDLDWALDLDIFQNFYLTVSGVYRASPGVPLDTSTLEGLHRSLSSFNIQKPVHIEWVRLYLIDNWGFLTSIKIHGPVTNWDLNQLKTAAARLRCLKVDSECDLDFEYFTPWRESLKVLSITGPIHFGRSGAPVLQKMPELVELELADCSKLYYIDQVCGLFAALQSLRLYYSPLLTSSGLQRMFRLTPETLIKLNVSYTNAPDDNLLELLVRHGIKLVELRASCWDPSLIDTYGFTNHGLTSFLTWNKNTRLKKLELCRHRHLTPHIFTCKPACSLEHIDLRETACVGTSATNHQQVLQQVLEFKKAGVCGLAAKRYSLKFWKSRTASQQTAVSHATHILQIHFSHYKNITDSKSDRKLSGQRLKSGTFVIVRYWHETAVDFDSHLSAVANSKKLLGLNATIAAAASSGTTISSIAPPNIPPSAAEPHVIINPLCQPSSSVLNITRSHGMYNLNHSSLVALANLDSTPEQPMVDKPQSVASAILIVEEDKTASVPTCAIWHPLLAACSSPIAASRTENPIPTAAFAGSQIGQPSSSTTPVGSPMSVDVASSYAPIAATRTENPIPTAAFAGSQIGQPSSSTTPVGSPMSVDVASSCAPIAASRTENPIPTAAFAGSQIGQPSSSTTPVGSPMSVDVASSYAPIAATRTENPRTHRC
jgi:hypothetical protein